jgi:hypothetical protein
MGTLKKYWPILAMALIALLFFIVGKGCSPTGDLKDRLVALESKNKALLEQRLADSAISQHRIDSITSIVERQKKEKKQLVVDLKKLEARNLTLLEHQRELTPPEQIKLFERRTGEMTRLIERNDSTIVETSVVAISMANEWGQEVINCLTEKDMQSEVIVKQDSIIKSLDALNAEQERINKKLTIDFYMSQEINKRLVEVGKDYQKKLNQRNWVIGGTVVIGTAAIIGASYLLLTK